MSASLLGRVIIIAAIATAPVQAGTVTGSNQGSSATATTAGTAQPAVKAEQKVCRQLPSSSSRLPNRVCLTAKEWQQVEDEESR